MVIKERTDDGRGWYYIGDVTDLICYPAKVKDFSMTACKAQTVMVEFLKRDGTKTSLGLQNEAYLMSDEGKTLEILHK